jgi:Cu+-exporting ATPase
LEEPAVRDRLLDFSDGKISRVRLHVPTMHCIACVWLLENLFRLRPGIGASVVDFPKKEVSIMFEPARIALSELVALLSALGYEPSFSLGQLEPRASGAGPFQRLLLRLGVAGFAFGNIMLFSVCLYAGLDSLSGPGVAVWFGWLSLALALPVLIFSAADYWRSAWLCVRQRVLTIDLPIAVGLVALFAQSAHEIVTQSGPGYLDSLTGLVFFLLIGRVFQQKTYERLSFDRDYKSFFPLSVVRRGAHGETTVPLSQLAVGDRLVLRHGELIPADARVVSGRGVIDYSFVTGEAEPVEKGPGELVYAGGQQTGGALEVDTVKPVSQSYLTSLWSHEAFAKPREDALPTILNRFSRRFTVTVAVVALGAALAWWLSGQPGTAVKAFTSVLIVACPCALALSAPFALGTAQRLLARRNIFLKNPGVIEALARIDTVVFDKTGTLTATGAARVEFQGAPLTPAEAAAVAVLAKQSTHPYSTRIHTWISGAGLGQSQTPGEPEGGATNDPRFPGNAADATPVEEFHETPGCGVEGVVAGRRIRLGSAAWFSALGVKVPDTARLDETTAHLALDGCYRGRFLFGNALRPETESLLAQLATRVDLALLSGDNARECERFRRLFGPRAHLHFNQSPLGKLTFIEELQRAHRAVMMVGDGLNDAGALKQSDVGVAVVENVGAFSPASDVILEATQVPRLGSVLAFARGAVRVVWLSILISSLYNVVGLSIAASGLLSPIVCAILMPLSSVSVVAFACGATKRVARRTLANAAWRRAKDA